MRHLDFLRDLVDRSPTPALLVDLDDRALGANDAYREMVAVSSQPPGPADWTALIHQADLDTLRRAVADAVTSCSAWTGTIRLSIGGAPSQHALVTPVPEADLAIVQFVETLAFHDELTGLPNRANLMKRLDGALLDARDAGRHIGVLFIDLDRFKVVNDSLGHSAGDDLLRVVAERITKTIRPEDVVARLGGDEFVVTVSGVQSHDDVTIAAERIRAAIARPITLGDGRTVITASIGIALADGSEEAGDLIRDADTALYRAKDLGRDRASMFDDLLRARAVHRHSTEQRLRDALERSAVEVHYQPIIEIDGGRLHGVEALVRVSDDEGALLVPSDFVAVAEDSGLIARIGQQVLDQALRDLAAWQERSPRPIGLSVNVSPRQLADQRYPSMVAAALSTYDLAPASLSLEITEHTLIDASPLTEKVLAELDDLGVELGLDDFGTGFSSLVYLKRYPITFVKIDKSFVAGIGRDDDDTAIVRATVALAHNLGLSVLAEGVERDDQLEILGELGCDGAQGFLLSPPVDADTLGGFLGMRWVRR